MVEYVWLIDECLIACPHRHLRLEAEHAGLSSDAEVECAWRAIVGGVLQLYLPAAERTRHREGSVDVEIVRRPALLEHPLRVTLHQQDHRPVALGRAEAVAERIGDRADG